MEFEVVFFYDLDEALQGDDKEMTNRHLYVEISRATSHPRAKSALRAPLVLVPLNTEKGNEEILKYFNRNAKDWK